MNQAPLRSVRRSIRLAETSRWRRSQRILVFCRYRFVSENQACFSLRQSFGRSLDQRVRPGSLATIETQDTPGFHVPVTAFQRLLEYSGAKWGRSATVTTRPNCCSIGSGFCGPMIPANLPKSTGASSSVNRVIDELSLIHI